MENGIGAFFAGKNVFLTGGSGFLGKVLIEKVLRCCPDVGNIYVLTRRKRGEDMRTRWRKLFNLEIFDKLKKLQPKALEKVIPIAGDIAELNLGLSEEDTNILADNVHIVYHVAATVRFDLSLKDALIQNTRGTREVCLLALKMKNIEVFLHVSTAYSQLDKFTIEEKFYPNKMDWKLCLSKVEELGDEIETVKDDYMGFHPNTYTFTKALAECVVHDLCVDKMHTVILRPTIVISTHRDPMDGWIDNFYGPIGLLIAAGTGLVRISFIDGNAKSDFIPVDIVIKALIMATWHQACRINNKKEITVYNCGSKDVILMHNKDLIELAAKLNWDTPLESCVWYPSTSTTTNKSYYIICFLLFQMLPALFLDIFLKMRNQKPRIVKIQKRVFKASLSLSYFMQNEWTIQNSKCIGLENYLNEKDRDAFGYRLGEIKLYSMYKRSLYGAKRYLLHDDLSDKMVAKLRIRVRVLYCLDRAIKVGFWFMVIYFVLTKCGFI